MQALEKFFWIESERGVCFMRGCKTNHTVNIHWSNAMYYAAPAAGTPGSCVIHPRAPGIRSGIRCTSLIHNAYWSIFIDSQFEHYSDAAMSRTSFTYLFFQHFLWVVKECLNKYGQRTLAYRTCVASYRTRAQAWGSAVSTALSSWRYCKMRHEISARLQLFHEWLKPQKYEHNPLEHLYWSWQDKYVVLLIERRRRSSALVIPSHSARLKPWPRGVAGALSTQPNGLINSLTNNTSGATRDVTPAFKKRDY